MSLFKGIEKVKAPVQSDYIRAGNYVLKVLKVEAGKNRNDIGFVALNFEVMWVIDAAPAIEAGISPHRIGDKISYLLSQKNESAARNLKAAIMGITGCVEGEVTEEAGEVILGPTQPLAGLLVEARCKHKPADKVKGTKDFTIVKFYGGVTEEALKDFQSKN